MTVDVGTRAAQGDLLGEAGATGQVTGPHVHWAVRVGNVSVDPHALMTAIADLKETLDVLTTR